MRRALAVVGVEQSRDAIIGGYAAQLVISEELHESDREDLTRLAAARNLDRSLRRRRFAGVARWSGVPVAIPAKLFA